MLSSPFHALPAETVRYVNSGKVYILSTKKSLLVLSILWHVGHYGGISLAQRTDVDLGCGGGRQLSCFGEVKVLAKEYLKLQK